ncbi:hypothetical protein K2173_015627 [Erythroxylum novogranatense]|uniref:Uncharacterized protein n=1 Tax=Erythroxylum novogranatense TaxID=1862640 RepID=A0AAV8SE89_9ROSI|nr:hypothetical protein K2173_015627 [Erythroxylum novogranatense]
MYNFLNTPTNQLLQLLLSLAGFETLSKLENLEFLYLSGNNFNSSILSSLVGLSLKRLDLRNNDIKGSINMTELNALSYLEVLDLSENEIIKFEPSRGASNLSVLYLDGLVNNITNELLESLGEFHNLTNLSLDSNNLIRAMFRYSLIELSLDLCSLDEYFLQSLELLPSLKVLSIQALHTTGLSTSQGYSLIELSLNLCSLDENFLQSLELLPSLKVLNIEALQTDLPISQGLCALKDLRDLDMRNNYLIGTLPYCMENLTSLRRLDLSRNNLSGDIYFSPLKSLISLESLVLSNNHFQIPLSLSPFFNHSKIKSFVASENEVYSRREMHNFIPKFQLQNLSLSCCGNGESFPQFLYYQHDLQYVGISHVRMKGRFPCWLLQNNTNLVSLDLKNTSLLGLLELPIQSHKNLTFLDISDNKLFGQIPSEIGACFPRLYYLNMSSNNFSGSIPSSLGNMNILDHLDLSNNGLHNNLSGGIPPWIINMTNLEVLDLSHNKLDGYLLPNLFPPYISQVYLSNNRLQGSMLNEFDCMNMIVIDLGQNNLTGGIPKWLGRCSHLGYLLLKGNNFEKEIPKQLCKLDYLRLVDLSSNYLCGRIPSCLRISFNNNISFIEDIDPSWSTFGVTSKPIQADFTTKNKLYSYIGKILNYLSGLDLSDNALEGVVPLEIGNFNTIQVLNLSHNKLGGPIPPTFSNLQKVESLDLSHNKLEGNIPSQLTRLHFLSVFSVAYNNLSGRTPDMVAQFATFENSSYEGNPFLCGSPLSRSCDPSLLSNNSSNRGEKEEYGFIDMNFFYISFGVSFIMMLLGIFAVLCINPYWRRAWFYFVGKIMNNFFYFVVDNVPILSKYRFYQPFE